MEGSPFIRRVPNLVNKNSRWMCQCTCGETTEVLGHNLRAGRVRSCGCLRQEYLDSRRLDRVIGDAGYVFVHCPDHPRAHQGKVREHIVVMEEILGRKLLPGEEVHHRNTDRGDNRPENLELWNHSRPSGARVSDQVEWAIEILRLYSPERLEA